MQLGQPMTSPEAVPTGPEVVIGLIGPLGVDLALLVSELSAAFASVAYNMRSISLIEPVLQYWRWRTTPTAPFNVRYDRRMDAGNEFRRELQCKDALAFLAMIAIQRCRREFHHSDPTSSSPASPIPRCAYLLRSLKTPEEVATLRETYGPNFVAVGAYMPRDARRESLMKRIAGSMGDPETRRHESEAARLLTRDEFEFEEYGQNMRETFPLADVFIDVSNQASTSGEARRFVEILFGHPSHTPRRAEAAMFHAYGAKLRSSSAGRQVGAAIVNTAGDLLSVGTNEVAKAQGGQYWSDEEDEHDERDHRRVVDSTSTMLSSILVDFLARLQRRGWLSADKEHLDSDGLRQLGRQELLRKLAKDELRHGDPPTLGDKALLEKLIEYMRPVHAEMAALTTCTRLGVPVAGCDMYVTTFPCHECARLIVASGIRSVHFIEPYPKSRVAEMYDDSIVVDQSGDEHHIEFRAFVGVSPRRFVEFFDAPEPSGRRPQSEVRRRAADGSWVRWEHVRTTRWPRQYDIPLAIMTREQSSLAEFDEKVARSGLRSPKEETK